MSDTPIHDAMPDLISAARRLSNEVLASLPLMEPLARREFGNSNYQIMIDRAQEIRNLLAKLGIGARYD